MTGSSIARVPQRGRRHSMTVVTEARRLSDGGWKPAEIRRLLAKDGTHVALATICRWVDPEAHRLWKERLEEWNGKRSAARGATSGVPRADVRPEFKLGRLQRLRNAGVSRSATATVLNLDFGDALTEDAVRRAETTNRYPVFDVGGERTATDLPDAELLSLRGDGFTFAAIAKIAARFYGVPLTEHVVRYRLDKLGAPKNAAKSAAVRQVHAERRAA